MPRLSHERLNPLSLSDMTYLTQSSSVQEAANLLTHYSFDLSSYTVEQLIDHWLRHYPAGWLRSAVIEALYQGRYKAVSVDQILSIWHRRGSLRVHFNHEFERIVCSKLPQAFGLLSDRSPVEASPQIPEDHPNLSEDDQELRAEDEDQEEPVVLALDWEEPLEDDSASALMAEMIPQSGDAPVWVHSESEALFRRHAEPFSRAGSRGIKVEPGTADSPIQPFKPKSDSGSGSDELMKRLRGEPAQPEAQLGGESEVRPEVRPEVQPEAQEKIWPKAQPEIRPEAQREIQLESDRSIEQFTPTPEASDFHTKLRAVAQNQKGLQFDSSHLALAVNAEMEAEASLYEGEEN